MLGVSLKRMETKVSCSFCFMEYQGNLLQLLAYDPPFLRSKLHLAVSMAPSSIWGVSLRPSAIVFCEFGLDFENLWVDHRTLIRMHNLNIALPRSQVEVQED